MSNSSTEMDESQAQRKKANKSITENYSWAGILQNAHTPSLQEQEVQQSLMSLK